MPEKRASSNKVPSTDLTGDLWNANCALDSGAKEMGISDFCTCQSFKSRLQEQGKVNINPKGLAFHVREQSQGCPHWPDSKSAGCCKNTEQPWAHTCSPETPMGCVGSWH